MTCVPHREFKGSQHPLATPCFASERAWDKVQAVLTENRVERVTGAYAKQPSLLAGLVFDTAGERLTATYAVKKGARYRYYVSTSLLKGKSKSAAAGWRIPAGNLESLVIDRLRILAKGELLDVIQKDAEVSVRPQQPLIERARHNAEALREKSPEEIKWLLTSLLTRVEIKSGAVQLSLCRHQLTALLTGQVAEPPSDHSRKAEKSQDIVTLKVAARPQRAGREMRMVVQNSDDQRPPDSSLLRILARAHDIQTRLMQNPDLSVHDIAHGENVSAAYIYSLLRLPWLAPDIASAIVNGRSPQQLTAKKLMRLSAHLPANWAEQKRMLGFS